MAGLIDTSALITLERRGAFTRQGLPALLNDEYFISSVTVSELLVGVHRAFSIKQRAARERGLARIFEASPCLPFGFEEARVHTEVQAKMMANGQLIGAHDLIIAATALAHDHFVLTHNLRDFQRVPGLTVKAVDW